MAIALEIGRKAQYGMGIESVGGTTVAPTFWLPLETAKQKEIVLNTDDVSGFGNIQGPVDAHLVKKMSEFTGKGMVKNQTFGWLLLLALGTAGAPSTPETGVYLHTFTVANTNTHPSATVARVASMQTQSGYNMVDSLTLDVQVGSQAKFELKMVGQSVSDTSALTPAYIATEDTFISSKAVVKLASAVAGLAAASAYEVSNIKFIIDKKLEQVYGTRTAAIADATDMVSQHNKNLAIHGDFEVVFRDSTQRDNFRALTKQAMSISIDGRTLIGATKYTNLTLQLNSVVLDSWELSDGNDALLTQKFGFTAMYKLSETAMVQATLQNTKATQYA